MIDFFKLVFTYLCVNIFFAFVIYLVSRDFKFMKRHFIIVNAMTLGVVLGVVSSIFLGISDYGYVFPKDIIAATLNNVLLIIIQVTCIR